MSDLSPNAFRVELSDGTWVSVEPSGALTASTFEELLDYLTVYQKVLQKRAAAPAPEGGLNDGEPGEGGDRGAS
jgi:hypothetical protein